MSIYIYIYIYIYTYIHTYIHTYTSVRTIYQFQQLEVHKKYISAAGG